MSSCPLPPQLEAYARVVIRILHAARDIDAEFPHD